MKLDNYTKGWIVGDFFPALINNKDIEVGIKKYKAFEYEKSHVHRVITEYTIIVSGKVKMNNQTYLENDVIEIKPGVSTDFLALEDTITVVIKTPSIPSDKYIINK